MRIPLCVAVFVPCLVLTLAPFSSAGPLTPPPGPVAPTKGPEPRTAVNATNTPGNAFASHVLSQPGSYYLESNISVPAGVTWGVSITAPGVTLDLNGFTIDGNNHGSNGGVIVNAPGVFIRNGTIRNVMNAGISGAIFPTGSPGLTVENVRVLGVSGPGIPPGGSLGSGTAGIFAGRGAVIRNCYVTDAAIGIAAGFNANISGCTVENTRQFGLNIEGGAMVSDCVVVGVTGAADEGHGFVLGTGSSVENCVARSNTGAGFVDTAETAFSNCRSSNNTGGGFIIGNFTRLEGCHAASNPGPAVQVNGADDWEITRCSFANNGGGGVILSGITQRGRIRDCTVRGQGGSSTQIGVKIPSGSFDIVVADSAFSNLLRVVELDGSYVRVTGCSMNQVFATVETSSGGTPDPSNFIGPILDASQANTATNPFANTVQ